MLKKTKIITKKNDKVAIKKKSLSISKLKTKLDGVFSKYIRLKDAQFGMNYCFTCGAYLPIDKLQNGHYYTRKNNNLRYSELNCHPQCVKCNMFQEGNKPVYAIHLVEVYGERILNDLHNLSKVFKKFTTYELIEMIEFYSQKLKELE